MSARTVKGLTATNTEPTAEESTRRFINDGNANNGIAPKSTSNNNPSHGTRTVGVDVATLLVAILKVAHHCLLCHQNAGATSGWISFG